MKVEEILLKIAGLKSVYGEAARICLNDSNLSKQFIMECYKEILDDREDMEDHFGKDVVDSILKIVRKLELK